MLEIPQKSALSEFFYSGLSICLMTDVTVTDFDMRSKFGIPVGQENRDGPAKSRQVRQATSWI